MSHRSKRMSSKVFGAGAAPLRLQILRLLRTQRLLGYSEIMNRLELNPSRDAGKFAYHLRNVLQAGLIDADEETKKYKLTPLGRMVIDFARSLEEYSLKEHGKLLVRTSRLAIEEFDRNKIVKVLTKEAGVPTELAQKIADETEERLLKLDTLYLTAPLIREFVNSILIEQGLHEYRHRLTRLGLPVYDVTRLVKVAEDSSLNVETVHKLAGDNVMKEYMLLNALPRKVADAHLSGVLHINNAGCWVLKPNEFQHDLRVLFHREFRTHRASFTTTFNPPKTFNAALSLSFAVLETAGIEIAGEQTINYFNVFLAPFARDLSLHDIKEALRLFIFNLSQTPSSGGFPTQVTLGMDFFIPKNLEEAEAFGPNGKKTGYYKDYSEESTKVLTALLELMLEDGANPPVLNPHLVFSIRPDNLKNDKETGSLLMKAHELAAKRGSPYFANLTQEWQDDATYSATGTRLASDWTEDWELDTIRTGNLDSVLINLPRIAYEAHGRDSRFFETLNDCLRMAGKALRIKHRTIKERVRRSLLPLLSQPTAEEPYFRLKNASCLVSFVGLNEAVKVQTGDQLHENKGALDFAKNIVERMIMQAKKLSRKSGLRMAVSQTPGDEAAQRLAELDVEKYGWANVCVQGTKGSPYYTDLVASPLETEISLKDRLRIENELHPLTAGGHLSIVELEEPEQNPENLLSVTKQVCQAYKIGFFTFTRDLSYCTNCQKLFGGILRKCLGCRSASSLVHYSRPSATYLPLERGIPSKKAAIGKRARYILS